MNDSEHLGPWLEVGLHRYPSPALRVTLALYEDKVQYALASARLSESISPATSNASLLSPDALPAQVSVRG